MACGCKNEQGEPLDRCLGICGAAKIIINEQKRAVELEHKIEGWFQQLYVLAQQSQSTAWKNGFREGFDLARDIYEN